MRLLQSIRRSSSSNLAKKDGASPKSPPSNHDSPAEQPSAASRQNKAAKRGAAINVQPADRSPNPERVAAGLLPPLKEDMRSGSVASIKKAVEAEMAASSPGKRPATADRNDDSYV